MTSAVQMAANRRNAQHSTGPRTSAGKSRSSQNALKHGFTGVCSLASSTARSPTTRRSCRSPFRRSWPNCAGDGARAGGGAQHRRPVRATKPSRGAGGDGSGSCETWTRILPPAEPGGPPRVAEEDLMRAGATALGADLFERLPRYEGHLNRELDKSLARYSRLRDARVQREGAIAGELVPPVPLAARAQ